MWLIISIVFALAVPEFAESTTGHFDDDGHRECDGRIRWKQLPRTPAAMKFHVKATRAARSDRECVEMCYRHLFFCRSVVYAPKKRTCFFSYWTGQECMKSGVYPAFRRHRSSVKARSRDDIRVYACIRCQPITTATEVFGEANYGKRPTRGRFSNRMQDDEGKEPRGASPRRLARLNSIWERAVEKADKLTDRPIIGSSLYNSVRYPDSPNKIIDDYRVSKSNVNTAYKFLMPECKKTLRYSTYAILNTNSFESYVQWKVPDYKTCAELCWRQHFCISALYENRQCHMSHKRGVCTDSALSYNYNGPVLISCFHCN